jgi:hypothetical protein
MRNDRSALSITTLVSLCALLVLSPGPAAADVALRATAGLGGLTKPGRWTPVRVDVTITDAPNRRGELVLSWGDTVVRRALTLSAGSRHYELYLRSAEPENFIHVRLENITLDVPVTVLSQETPVAVCVGGATVAPVMSTCAVTLAPGDIPRSVRGLEVADDIVITSDERALEPEQRTAVERWRSFRQLDASGHLGLTPQVTRPLQRRGLPGTSARPVLALVLMYVSALLVLGLLAGRLKLRVASVAAGIAALLVFASVTALTIGRVGWGSRITILHQSMLQQLPTTDGAMLTLRGLAVYPSNDQLDVRFTVGDGVIEPTAASERSEQIIDDGGFPLLFGRKGLGARQAFSAEAVIGVRLLAMSRVARTVRISNTSSFNLRDCRFGEGLATSAVGDLTPGASASVDQVGDVIGPLFTCTVDAPLTLFSHPDRGIDAIGTTQVVLYDDDAVALNPRDE